MLSPTVLRQLEQALATLHYGSVQLIVHEAQIVRIERIERIRLTNSPEDAASSVGKPTTSQEVRHEQEERL